MRALSIKQPYAELIFRGIKRIEYRSRATKIIGERFWIYAPRQPATGGRQRAAGGTKKIWSGDVAADGAPPWMVEMATALRLFRQDLPCGVIVGSAVIERVTPIVVDGEAMFAWHLVDVERARRLRKPIGHPQPVWFTPF